MTPPYDPLEIARLVARHLDELGVTYTVGGSIASSFAGEPRSTIDIDMVVALEDWHIRPLVEALSAEFYVDDEALARAVRMKTRTNLVHQPTQTKVDLFIAGGTPLDRQQLERRLRVDIGEGRHVYVHPPEDILLQKLRWFRIGGETSDRQWRDILAIVRVQGSRLDLAYLRRNAVALDVAALLERALADAAPPG